MKMSLVEVPSILINKPFVCTSLPGIKENKKLGKKFSKTSLTVFFFFKQGGNFSLSFLVVHFIISHCLPFFPSSILVFLQMWAKTLFPLKFNIIWGTLFLIYWPAFTSTPRCRYRNKRLTCSMSLSGYHKERIRLLLSVVGARVNKCLPQHDLFSFMEET